MSNAYTTTARSIEELRRLSEAHAGQIYGCTLLDTRAQGLEEMLHLPGAARLPVVGDSLALARAAGRASGSAARSLYGGFVELTTSENSIEVDSVLAAGDWPLDVVVAVTADTEKLLSSGDAMIRSAGTSPFYKNWVSGQDHDLDVARTAVAERDFAALAAIAEHNCLKMHSVMWASRPPIVYWNAATIACMQTVRNLQADDIPVFFTIDAGPQVKAVCLPDSADQVRNALRNTDGVLRTMHSNLGDGARLLVDP